MSELSQRMSKSVDALKSQLASLRVGRAHPDMLNKIMVSYYDVPTPLKQVASVSVPEPRVLMLTVFDKAALKDVEKAIATSDLGIPPVVDGTVIRLRLPELTEDRRKELVKQMKKMIEEAKVAIRNQRRDFIDELKSQEKDKSLSVDESKSKQDDAQRITDSFIAQIDQLAKDKESDIMTV